MKKQEFKLHKHLETIPNNIVSNLSNQVKKYTDIFTKRKEPLF